MSDLYIEEWHSETSDYFTERTLQEPAMIEVGELEAQFDAELLKTMIKINNML